MRSPRKVASATQKRECDSHPIIATQRDKSQVAVVADLLLKVASAKERRECLPSNAGGQDAGPLIYNYIIAARWHSNLAKQTARLAS